MYKMIYDTNVFKKMKGIDEPTSFFQLGKHVFIVANVLNSRVYGTGELEFIFGEVGIILLEIIDSLTYGSGLKNNPFLN